MRVAFDPQIFLLQEYGGISRYVCSLARQLTKSAEVDVRIIAPLHYNKHLQDLPCRLGQGWRVPRIRKTFRMVCAASEFLSSQAMRRFRPDVVHETYFSNRVLGPGNSRRIITVYDMISERFPIEFPGRQFTEAKKHAIARADHVLCISDHTRRDLIDLFGVAPQKTSVVYLGYDDLIPSVDPGSEVSMTNQSRPYLLYVGSRGGYKNFRSLLAAFASSAQLKSDCAIVCFGGGRLDSEERALLHQLGLSEVHVQQVSGNDAMLASTYRNATAFVYPSLYEGFGIPPLEAMSLGCPVICSNTTSIPEVVGDAGEYFDPSDPETIRVAIERVVYSSARRNELVNRGNARRAIYSWQRCAKETLDVYRSIL